MSFNYPFFALSLSISLFHGHYFNLSLSYGLSFNLSLALLWPLNLSLAFLRSLFQSLFFFLFFHNLSISFFLSIPIKLALSLSLILFLQSCIKSLIFHFNSIVIIMSYQSMPHMPLMSHLLSFTLPLNAHNCWTVQ
jgi:hypothetical protein